MIIEQDERFREERRRYRLRFTCEDCALFDEARERCAHGYPTERHRAARYADPTARILFCKEFDLA
jgi:hypothetical protein